MAPSLANPVDQAPDWSLRARILLLAGLLAAEWIPLSFQVFPAVRSPFPVQFWYLGLSKYVVSLAALYATALLFSEQEFLPDAANLLRPHPIRWRRLLYQAAAWLATALFSYLLKELPGSALGPLFAALRIGGAVSLVGLAAWTFFPVSFMTVVFRRTYKLFLGCLAVIVAVRIINGYRSEIWGAAAGATFRLVRWLLSPVLPHMILKPAERVIGTRRFLVQVADVCSGVEGASLMLAFSATYLWVFRRECRFPVSLLLIPAGIGALFLTNAVRIAALVLLGHYGASEMAIQGFHSEAGWVLFIAVALAFGEAIRRLPARKDSDLPVADKLR